MNRVCKKKKKKSRTLNSFKTIFILMVITVCIYIIYCYKFNGNIENIVQIFSKFSSKIELQKTNTLEQSYSSNNSIKGQILVEDKDGYDTIFKTLNSKHQKVYKEFKQNIDSSWSENSYWGGTMRQNGCGITSIAIIASRI